MSIGGNQFLQPQALIDFVGVAEGDYVGDLGCGSGGYFTIPFAYRVGPTGVVYAVDVLKEALETVNSAAKSKNLVNVKTLWSNLEIPMATKIPAGSLNFTFLINILFQSNNKMAILQEASRMTKKGGKLVVVDWRRSVKGFGPSESIRVDLDNILSQVVSMGFEKFRIEDLGQYHFVAIFKKL